MARFSGRMILAGALLAALMGPSVGQAGTGYAVSGPASIDTRLPVVTIDGLPVPSFWQAGEAIPLTWTISDDNPVATDGANVAEVWLGDSLYAAHLFAPGAGQHVWNWSVPDTTSAFAHLVVRSTDSFGNIGSARGEDFTILSATTDAPQRLPAPVFAPPAPNPFNPLTLLRFHLPLAGPVTVTVHDARGYRVNTLLQANRPAGPLELRWDGTDETGRRQAGGTYFFRLVYRLEGQSAQAVRKAVLLP